MDCRAEKKRAMHVLPIELLRQCQQKYKNIKQDEANTKQVSKCKKSGKSYD